MNPMMAFGGGQQGGGGGMKNDLRIVAIILAACFSLLFSFLSDHAVFVKPPESHFVALLAYACDLGYKITESRLLAFGFAFGIFFTTMVVFGVIFFFFLEVYIIEPIAAKWRMIYAKREKHWMNKYDDGTM
jgi:hypothetical protein